MIEVTAPLAFPPRTAKFLCLGALLSACASGGSGNVTAADLPRLQQEAADRPTDGRTVLRLAAAMRAAGDCPAAIETASRGMDIRPQDAIGPLVLGACLEERGEAAEAVEVYDAFLAAYPNAVGSSAVAGRVMLTRRALYTDDARALLARESSLGAAGGDPNVLAVMPLEVIGDETYAALSLGLASMITSDLGLVGRIQLVERAQLESLLREIRLGQAGMVDVATAARAGRMLQAGTVAHGLTHVSADEQFLVEVSLLDSESRVGGTRSVRGRLRDLFALEKELVIGIIDELGIALTQVERNAILENGTQNLAAFLAYSTGLLEQDGGNYAAAADAFSQAVRADPAFQQARDAFQVSSGASAVEGAGPAGLGSLASVAVANPTAQTGAASAAAAIATGVQDVAPTLIESLSGSAGASRAVLTSTSSAPPATSGGVLPVVLFGLRVLLQFP